MEERIKEEEERKRNRKVERMRGEGIGRETTFASAASKIFVQRILFAHILFITIIDGNLCALDQTKHYRHHALKMFAQTQI